MLAALAGVLDVADVTVDRDRAGVTVHAVVRAPVTTWAGVA